LTTYYLSGPMRGIPEFNFPQFYEAEAALWGWVPDQDLDFARVLNPARDFGGDPNRPYADYMQADLEQVLRSDVIVLLPGWRESEGAGREVRVALWTGKRFMAAVRSAGSDGKTRWGFEEIPAPSDPDDWGRANPALGTRVNLGAMAREVEEVNVEKGWYDDDRTFGDLIALLHSEVSEALEAFRKWGLSAHVTWVVPKGGLYDISETTTDEEFRRLGFHAKPEGVGSEFADVLIRLLDMCRRYGIDLDAEYLAKLEYNRTREYRHGGKRL
jgi:NTP pyrophosphatase (non-canonical NTP hydrolase)